MARILITSGPTRQYLDPVRYLSNGSSGRMGACLADAAIDLGHQVVIVSGPVAVDYPEQAMRVDVVSTEEMLAAVETHFPNCDGLIGAAAPCDYRPVEVSKHKIKKSGESIKIELVETPDIVAGAGKSKRADQWTVGFALETEDPHFRAITKLQKKCCDLVVINGANAIDSETNSVEMIDPSGKVIARDSGGKRDVAIAILREIQQRLINRAN